MNLTSEGECAAIKPVRFIEDNVLPDAYEMPPEKWPNALRAAIKGLSKPEREAVLSEARRIAKARKRVVDALADGLESVRAESHCGRPLRDVVLGALIFGSFTGVSCGEPAVGKALDPRRINDLDFIPVLAEDPSWGIDWTPEDKRKVYLAFRARLGRRVTAALNIKASPTWYPMWVRQADPEATRKSFDAELRVFDHIYPEPWHYIGDEATRPMVEDAIRSYKESCARRMHDTGGR